MATQTVEFAAASGLSLTLKMFTQGSDTEVDSQSATEETNRKSVYTASFTDLPAAVYTAIAFDGSEPASSFTISIEDSTATYRELIETNLAAILVDTGTTLPSQISAINDTVGDIDVATTAILVDTATTLPSLIGDATEAKQDEILSKLTTVTFLATAQPDSITLELVQGDAYDGTANASLVWTASKDVTGETIEFSIRDETDTLILDTSTSGVAASASGTTITVTLDSTATRLLKACEHKFDVEVQFSSSSKMTVANGLCTVYQDQSR